MIIAQVIVNKLKELGIKFHCEGPNKCIRSTSGLCPIIEYVKYIKNDDYKRGLYYSKACNDVGISAHDSMVLMDSVDNTHTPCSVYSDEVRKEFEKLLESDLEPVKIESELVTIQTESENETF